VLAETFFAVEVTPVIWNAISAPVSFHFNSTTKSNVSVPLTE
jgi:hypothetical protein